MSTPSEYSPDTSAIYDALKGQLERRHCAELAASGITPEVAAARGYRTIANDADGRNGIRIGFGFADYQCCLPGYLLPIYGVDGQRVAAQLKPDSPRTRDHKNVKYETAENNRVVVDVPPTCQPDLANPAIALWVTDGVKKADSGASHGLCIVALAGVWNWRGVNENGGKVALPCWNSIALNGRKVFIAFDSDAVTKPLVQQAEQELARFLDSKGAEVGIIRIPSGRDGAKVGLDDLSRCWWRPCASCARGQAGRWPTDCGENRRGHGHAARRAFETGIRDS